METAKTKNTQVKLLLSPDLHRWLKVYAATNGRTMAAEIIGALTGLRERVEKEKAHRA